MGVSTLGLKMNNTLLTLELGSNNLSDSGAGYLSEVLKVNRRLEGLSLWQNNITEEVWSHDVIPCHMMSYTNMSHDS